MANDSEKNIETIDELVKELEKMDESYDEKVSLSSESIPESLGLQKKEDLTIDENQIGLEVAGETQSEYEDKKQKVSDDAALEITSKEEEKSTLEDSTENKKSSVNEIMDSNRIVAENDTLKRGLARSSIAVSKLSNIEDSRARELVDLANSLEDGLNKIEKEITSLEKKRDASLENLDIELSDEIEDRITSKVAELKKAQDEVLEYNNKISELESKYKADRASKMSAQQKTQFEFEQKYGSNIKNEISLDKYNYALEYFNKMPKTQAISQLISSPSIAKSLGDRFYDLYYVQSRR